MLLVSIATQFDVKWISLQQCKGLYLVICCSIIINEFQTLHGREHLKKHY